MTRAEIETYLLHAKASPETFVLDEQVDLLEAAIRREVLEARINVLEEANAVQYPFRRIFDQLNQYRAELAAHHARTATARAAGSERYRAVPGSGEAVSERIRSMHISIEKALEIEAEIARLASRVAELEGENAKLRLRYEELIFAVGHKFPEETRHETALRYIVEAERPNEMPAQAARAGVTCAKHA